MSTKPFTLFSLLLTLLAATSIRAQDPRPSESPVVVRNQSGAKVVPQSNEQEDLNLGRSVVEELAALREDIASSGVIAGKVAIILLELQQQMASNKDIESGTAAQSAAVEILIDDLSGLRGRTDQIITTVRHRVQGKLKAVRSRVQTRVDFAADEAERSQWVVLLGSLDEILSGMESQTAWLETNRTKLDVAIRQLIGQLDFLGTVRLIGVYGMQVVEALSMVNERLASIVTNLQSLQLARGDAEGGAR